MTYTEDPYQRFLEQLKELNILWRVRPDGETRSRDNPIRSPLTAMAQARSGEVFKPHQWREATHALGLPADIAEKIQCASELDVTSASYDREMRVELPIATGILKRDKVIRRQKPHERTIHIAKVIAED